VISREDDGCRRRRGFEHGESERKEIESAEDSDRSSSTSVSAERACEGCCGLSLPPVAVDERLARRSVLCHS